MQSFKYILILCVACLFISKGSHAQKQYQVLCYHNIVVHEDSARADDVSLKNLILHFEWLKKENYQSISLQEIIDGKTFTNPKQVLFSFDDGYASFYTCVFPLLKMYNFKAVVALVGIFQEDTTDSVQYTADQKLPRSYFLSWSQINEMEESGLVEFISHSYDLHKSIPANKQGNLAPAATTIQYDSIQMRFETLATYTDRIKNDLLKSSKQLRQKLKRFIPCIVWPYGRYNDTLIQIAKTAGFQYSLNLVGEANYDFESVHAINRFYVNNKGPIDQLRNYLDVRPNNLPITRGLFLKTAQFLGDTDSTNESKLSHLLENIYATGPNTIVLPLMADSQKVYFTNTYLPYQSNQLFRLIGQIQSRTNAEVAIHLQTEPVKKLLPVSDWINFGAALGMQAPARKILLDSKELIQLFQTDLQAHKIARVSNAITQSKNRQKYLHTFYHQFPDLKFLENYTHYQPDVSVFLVIPANQLQLIADSTTLQTILFYFSGVVVDLTGSSDWRVLNKQIAQLQARKNQANRIQVSLPALPAQKLQQLVAGLLKQGIFSYYLHANDFPLDKNVAPLINTKDKASLSHD